MKQTFAMWSCCGALIAASQAFADEPKTNELPARSSLTNAQPSPGSIRAEFSEISAKLQELQKQATNAPEVKAVVAELQTARNDLKATQKKVMDLQQKLRETVIAEVTKLDPSAKQLIDRQQQLLKEIHRAGGPAVGLTNRPLRVITPTDQPSATAATNQPSSSAESKPTQSK